MRPLLPLNVIVFGALTRGGWSHNFFEVFVILDGRRRVITLDTQTKEFEISGEFGWGLSDESSAAVHILKINEGYCLEELLAPYRAAVLSNPAGGALPDCRLGH